MSASNKVWHFYRLCVFEFDSSVLELCVCTVCLQLSVRRSWKTFVLVFLSNRPTSTNSSPSSSPASPRRWARQGKAVAFSSDCVAVTNSSGTYSARRARSCSLHLISCRDFHNSPGGGNDVSFLGTRWISSHITSMERIVLNWTRAVLSNILVFGRSSRRSEPEFNWRCVCRVGRRMRRSTLASPWMDCTRRCWLWRSWSPPRKRVSSVDCFLIATSAEEVGHSSQHEVIRCNRHLLKRLNLIVVKHLRIRACRLHSLSCANV